MPKPDEPTSSDRRDTAHVFAVPPGVPFLQSLVQSILDGTLPGGGHAKPGPLDLPDVTLILPTRRAVRAVQDTFLKAASNTALMLPKVLAISEGEEDLTLMTMTANSGWTDAGLHELPPPMDDIERQMTLTRLVMQWSAARAKSHPNEAGGFLAEDTLASGSETPAQAARLAADLARLMDIVETEDKSLQGLADLVPETFSLHWQETLAFLDIITKMWPAYLSERQLTSQVARRNAAILAEAKRMRDTPPATPVIIAGVTGSIPATAELMRVVSRLPLGAVVLPGVDLMLDDDSWQAIDKASDNGHATWVGQGHPEHPQYGLKLLIDGLGIHRSNIIELATDSRSPEDQARQRFISETLRPTATTAKWQDYNQQVDRQALRKSFENVSLIETDTADDEAEAIALILRQAAEIPGRTAALVSPDRLLARRVAIRLESWGIRVDDSAGRPFVKTVPGTFLDLVINAAANNFAPPDVVALLKHPLTRLGLDPFSVRKAARNLEIACFRGAYFGAGLDGIEAALERAAHDSDEGKRQSRAVRRIAHEHWHGARDLVQRLKAAFSDFADHYETGKPLDFKAMAIAHVKAAEAIARLPETEGDTTQQGGVETTPDADTARQFSPLWKGEAGEEGSNVFAKFLTAQSPELEITPDDYGELYRGLLVGRNVRPRVAVHPRLSIWGPFESRLQQPDVIVLGSLNDGVWPEATDPGPWLNRSMRQSLGLPSPEEELGRSALDFSMLMGAGTVYLSRAKKVGSTPTVPSRWLMRMQALSKGLGEDALLQPDHHWVNWARLRNKAPKGQGIARPAPTPPVAARPRTLSVSRIENWIANPYAIFAGSILKLDPLPAIGEEPDAALRGSVIHLALSRFSSAYPDHLPDDVAPTLMNIAAEIMSDYRAHPRIAAFWLPRFQRFADWFAETEPERRAHTNKVVAETTGRLILEAPAGSFTLTARADRIDVGSDGLVITDYKTGTFPSDEKVKDGRSPQLVLEAAIALLGEGFAHCGPASNVTALRYISASGGVPAGDQRDVKIKDISAAATQQTENLQSLVTRFDNPDTPYTALRRPNFKYDYDDFAHLARVAEWSVLSDEGGEA
jgi:ATP-dependent helicase/nuclease subunit B